MKNRIHLELIGLFGFVSLILPGFAPAAHARRAPARVIPKIDTALPHPSDLVAFPRVSRAPALASTTWLGSWNFDEGGFGCNAGSWTSSDLTEQGGTFWHVDDFAGLGGGSFGRLNAIEGTQSLWCGAAPGSSLPGVCAYATLPGYGNIWDQMFATDSCLAVSGDVTVRFLAAWDTETGYDEVHVEWDRCDDAWTPVSATTFDGIGGPSAVTETIAAASHAGAVRLRLRFTSDGSWSDEDGLNDTDGAMIVDSLQVFDATGTVLAPETFEDEMVGATAATGWSAQNDPGYGDYAALFPGTQLVQQDPCVSNLSCMWAFINGSTFNYACRGLPNQAVVPFGNARGQYIHNVAVSPVIPLVGSGDDIRLEYDEYLDLPLDDLLFSVWYVRSIVAGCVGPWKTNTTVFYYGAQKTWQHQNRALGPYVDPSAASIQVGLGVIDLCPMVCGVWGSGACHSHTPLYDNVSVYRVAGAGPQWLVRDEELFQDTFPGDGTITGTARADMAVDTRPSWNPGIVPGDSAVVTVSPGSAPLHADPTFGGPSVYCYVSNSSGRSGAELSGNTTRWPVVGTAAIAGRNWTVLRMDSVHLFGAAVADKYCVDLNDNLFTPGDVTYFVFSAIDSGGNTTYYTRETRQTAVLATAFATPMEFSVLPTGNSTILYVDGMDGRGAQPYFDTAFASLGITPDRYDIRAPSWHLDNRPGSRVANVLTQVAGVYKTIIWSTGNLPTGLIGDGTGSPEKSDDALLLYTFLDQGTNVNGVYFTGDNIAQEWASGTGLSGSGPALFGYIQHTLVSGDHQAALGDVSPLLAGTPGGCFAHPVADTAIAYGGCPWPNDFDVIAPSGASAVLEMSYAAGAGGGAVVSQTSVNSVGDTVVVVLSGFGLSALRSTGAPAGVSVRAHHLGDVLDCLSQAHSPVTAARPTTARNELAQNVPNPFNPSTTIRFSLRQRSKVTLSVYDVRGRRVRTLVRGVRTAGVEHVVAWDGRDDAGAAVSSGVYFYRLVAGSFTQTRKMLLLK